jgi:hypothetical protein
MSWSRLVRFESEGKTYYGEPEIESDQDLPTLLKEGKLYAKAFTENSVFDVSTVSSTHTKVSKLLAILEPEDVPIIKCVGLNYIKHSV